MLVSSCALNQGHSNQDVMYNSLAQFTSLHKLQDKKLLSKWKLSHCCGPPGASPSVGHASRCIPLTSMLVVQVPHWGKTGRPTLLPRNTLTGVPSTLHSRREKKHESEHGKMDIMYYNFACSLHRITYKT